MVLQKRRSGMRNAPNKKSKTVFEEVKDDDLDLFDDNEAMDDDSDEKTAVQKTPRNKTPKGRQSLSEKKVSFQMPGKNTPNKNSALSAKKQPQTPGNKGKTAVQEFKGIKGKKNQPKQADDEEEEDDDEEDDLDEDDLEDLLLDDDDDDEEDDDEEDDDDDDDDEEEEEDDEEEEEDGGNIQTKLTLLKQKNGNEQNKKASPKGKNAQNNQEKESPSKASAQLPVELERRRARDAKMLFIGNLPRDATREELKTLSSDILDVVMPNKVRQRDPKVVYAFLVFASEKMAESNYESLQSKKFRDQLINIDFVGEKSKNKKTVAAQEKKKEFNLKKLYVSGIPINTTMAEVAQLFPAAFQITFNTSTEYRTASINFSTVEAANAAFESNKNSEIKGNKLIVLHAIEGKQNKRKNNRQNKKRNSGPPNIINSGSPNKKNAGKPDGKKFGKRPFNAGKKNSGTPAKRVKVDNEN